MKTTIPDYPNKSLTERILGAAMEVDRELGPGLLESAYQVCPAHELNLQHIPFEQQIPIPVRYKGISLDCDYRLDFWVDRLVIVELKAVDALLPVHSAQLLAYLKLMKVKVGLLINFNVPVLKSGIKRLVNDLLQIFSVDFYSTCSAP